MGRRELLCHDTRVSAREYFVYVWGGYMSISEFHIRFTKVNVTLPFHNKVWKDFWYRFNKLRYRDWNALLTTPWPPYLKHIL